jgi:hypothetical protein
MLLCNHVKELDEHRERLGFVVPACAALRVGPDVPGRVVAAIPASARGGSTV